MSDGNILFLKAKRFNTFHSDSTRQTVTQQQTKGRFIDSQYNNTDAGLVGT